MYRLGQANFQRSLVQAKPVESKPTTFSQKKRNANAVALGVHSEREYFSMDVNEGDASV